ncbi:MAG: ATP-binding protein [Gallionellaceae bacterium]|nr:ATP-binding protein [Gallionellaceae bacterium]
MSSIRGRLLLWQISALLLTGLLVSVITYLLAWDGFNRIRDYGLEQIAYSVVRHGVQYDNDEEVRNDRGQFVSQIWAADGSLFFSSLDDVGPPRQESGLHILKWENAEWRVFSLKEGGLTIQVATTAASRARRFASIAPWLLIPLVVLVVVLGLLIHAAVTRALAPLEQVRGEIGRRGVQSLHALDSRSLPDEVAPLVETLNDLLVRLDQALVSQRRFTADAAHELRTPLTAVKLQAQIARRASNEAERDAALTQLCSGVDRAAHLVDQLLGMARLEPAARQAVFAPLALDALAKQTVADFSTQAEARDIDLGVGECAAITLTGQIESLRMMLGNLLDNAVRYTPNGGRVDVELREQDGMARLSVSDNGPGIPAAERGRVFERFQRLAGADIPGSGLGLAIVKQVVDLHGGKITLDDAPGGGLKVTVLLPLQ